MDAYTPLCTWINKPANPEEIAQLFQRQAAIDRLLEGKESASTVLDMFAEHGQDPLAYLDQVEAEVETLIGFQVEIEGGDFLLRQRE